MRKIDNNHIIAIIILTSIVVLFLPMLQMHFTAFLDHYILHEETRSRYVYHTLVDPQLFKGDYITQFLSKQYQIERNNIVNLYYLFIKFSIRYIDLETALKALILLLVVVTLATVAIASFKLGGFFSACCSVIFASSLSIISYQITAPIPHMFAFAFIGMFICAMLYGRVYLMGIIVIISGDIYLPIAIISGTVLAIYLLLMPKQYRGTACNWSIRKSLVFLSLIAIIPLYSMYNYMFYEVSGYGEYIAPLTDKYPETDYGGRYFTGATNPIFYCLMQYFSSFKGGGLLVFVSLICIIYYAGRRDIYFKWQTKITDKESYYRISSYLIGVAILFIAIYTYKPSFSYRILLYGIVLLHVIILPPILLVAAKQYFANTNLGKYKDLPRYVTLIAIISLTILTDKSEQSKFGYIKLPDSHKAIYEFAKDTPKDTLFAGMPSYHVDKVNVIDYIPYISKRSAFLHMKGYQVFYEDYLLNMRQRMQETLDAYYGNEAKDVIALKEKYGVRYFIINTEYYKEPMPFFNPFKEDIKNRVMQVKDNEPFLLKNLDKAKIKSQNLYLFDLNDL